MTSIRPFAVVHVPAAPMLIDVVAGAAAADVADIRTRAILAIADALEDRAGEGTPVTDVVVVTHRTGRASGDTAVGSSGWGYLDLAPIGVRHRIGDEGLPPLTTPAQIELAVGVHLLEAALADALLSVPRPRVHCIDLTGRDAAALAGIPEDALVIAVADGSAAREVKAPGYVVPGAVDYDEALIHALDDGDLAWFAAHPPRDDYLVGGYPVWCALAEVLPTPVGSLVHHWAAPLGVCYVVATWRCT
jgi:hypothetical protein